MDILFEIFIQNTNLDQNIIEQEYIYQIYTQVKRLKEVFREATENSNEKITLATASKLLIKHLFQRLYLSSIHEIYYNHRTSLKVQNADDISLSNRRSCLDR